MSWHDPELYLFLCVLAVFTALLAITYELVSRRRKPPVIPTEEKPLDGLNESGPWSKPMTGVADLALPASMPDSRQAGKQEAERFSRLCESTNDLPAKEQASRVREHFGIFGGVRPHRRNEGDAPVYLKNVRPLEGLARDRPLPNEERQKDVPPKTQAACVTISETSQEHGPCIRGRKGK